MAESGAYDSERARHVGIGADFDFEDHVSGRRPLSLRRDFLGLSSFY